MNQKCIIIFNSIHRVMKAEKVLKEENVDFELIPTPRELKSDCGLAIKVLRKDEKKVENILKNKKVKIAELHII
jgi:hypothetical protein